MSDILSNSGEGGRIRPLISIDAISMEVNGTDAPPPRATTPSTPGILDRMMVQGLEHDDFRVSTPRPGGDQSIRSRSRSLPHSRSRSPSQTSTRSPSPSEGERAEYQMRASISRSRSPSQLSDRGSSPIKEEGRRMSNVSRSQTRSSSIYRSQSRSRSQLRSPSARSSDRSKHRSSSERSPSERPKKSRHKKRGSRSVKQERGRSRRKVRYFVMKSYDDFDVSRSQEHSLWATQKKNEPILDDSFDSCDKVVLFFSVNRSGHFQGYAKMTSGVGHAPSNIWSSKDGRATWGGAFGVEWKMICNLPFNETTHLHNPWNDNKPVKICRDGQELPPELGEDLLKLFREYKDSGKKSIPRKIPPGMNGPPSRRRRHNTGPGGGPPRYQPPRNDRSRSPRGRGGPRRHPYHHRGRGGRYNSSGHNFSSGHDRRMGRSRSSRRSRSPNRHSRGHNDRQFYYTRGDLERMSSEQRSRLFTQQRNMILAAARYQSNLSPAEIQRMYAQKIDLARRLGYHVSTTYPYGRATYSRALSRTYRPY